MRIPREKDAGIPIFAIDVTLNYASLVLNFLLASITGVILARSLGPAGKGVFSLCITIPSMAAVLVSLGINSSNVYLIAKKKYPIGLIAGNAFFYSVCAGSLAAIVLRLLAPFYAERLFGDTPPIVFYAALPMIPLVLLFENITYIFIGFRNMFQHAVVSVGRTLVYCLLLIVFLYPSGLLISEALGAYICGLVFSVILGTYILFRNGYLQGLALNNRTFLDALRFGLKQHLGTIAQFFNYRLDLLIIAVLLNTTSVGLYSVAVMLSEVVWYFPRALGTVLFPKTASSDRGTADSFTPFACRSTILVTLPVIVALFLVSARLIPWVFSSAFEPSVLTLKLLLPGVLFFSVGKVIASDIVGRGYPHYNSVAATVALALTVILDLLLIPRWGINGAAVATTITYIVHTTLIALLFKKITGIGLIQLVRFQKSDFVAYYEVTQSILKKVSPRGA